MARKVILSVAGFNKPIVTKQGTAVTDGTYNYTILNGGAAATSTYIDAGTMTLTSGEGTITLPESQTQGFLDPILLILQDANNGGVIGGYEVVISTDDQEGLLFDDPLVLGGWILTS